MKTRDRLRLGAAAFAAMAPSVAAADAAMGAVTILVPPSAMHAVEGINFAADGMLYGTSIHGQAVYRIDPQTGVVRVAVPSPDGESDDVAIGPPGTPVAGVLAWTAQRSGEIRIQRPGGKPEVLVRNLPRVNPIAFRADGRLFTAQVGAGEDALWELDATGDKPPRLVASNRGQLNGFGFGADGRLYAPQFRTDKLVAIDVDSGQFTTIASGVGAPAAAKMAANGDVISVDYLKGDVWRTSAAGVTAAVGAAVAGGAAGVAGAGGSRDSRIIAALPAPIDSLAIAGDGTIFVSSVADSSIFALDPQSGRWRDVVRGWFTMTLGMTMTELQGRRSLLVADPFGYRYVDLESGAVTRPAWAANRGASSAIAASERFLAFTYAESARIRKIDRSSDQIVAETTAVAAPRGVALTRDQQVIVADAKGGRLVKLTADGVVDIAVGLDQPVGLVLESDDSALVTQCGGGSVARVDLRSGRHKVLVSGLHKPTGLALMQDGRLAIVEPDLGRVIAVDLKSNSRVVLASGLALSLRGLDMPANTPAGISVGPDGTVYVSCPGNNSVVGIRPPARPQRRPQ